MSEGVRRIFFDKFTGDRIVEIGRGEGMTIPPIDRDIETYTALSERNRETFDVLELPFDELEQDFAESSGYRVNVETRELEFSYPDPSEPQEPVYQPPLTEQVNALKNENTELKLAIAELAETNESDKIDMQLALAELAELVTGGV